MKLYVTSISIGAVDRSPGLLFHSCDLRKNQSTMFYTEEDQKAIEFLSERGIHCELIDLARCPFLTRLDAKIKGINKTPSLLLDDGTKLKGIQPIESHFTKQTS